MALRFTKLTRPNIRALGVGENVTEHGITAERLKDGDVRYSVNVMVDGERVHRVIGRESDGTTRSQAETFIGNVRTDAREGRLSLPKGRKTHISFRKSASEYISRQDETGGRNIEAKRRQFRLYLIPFFGDQRLDSITTFTVDRYKRRRQESAAKNSSINRELATLSHLFNSAIEWKWLKDRPCRIALLPEIAGRIVVLTDTQADALLRAAMQDEDPYCWLFVLFGLNTAMRHREILCARFDQLDFENRRLYVPQGKAGDREQPITPQLTAVLESERSMRDDPDGWIFPSPRPKASTKGQRYRMGKPFARAVMRAGLDPNQVTPHVMRHTAITNLVQAGIDLPTIQRISGHKTLKMVLRYTHVHGRHIDQAIQAIGRGLPEPVANKTADTTTPELHTLAKRPA